MSFTTKAATSGDPITLAGKSTGGLDHVRAGSTLRVVWTRGQDQQTYRLDVTATVHTFVEDQEMTVPLRMNSRPTAESCSCGQTGDTSDSDSIGRTRPLSVP